ncbi:MAG: DUF72 domain-containing protein [Ignisphaera sp.]|nr:DUF72 domain-containing protein [Ignisphaera sp.]MDW8085369.1 DUF72 domain-containing protein [Ignisphaera sp.]
MILVGCCGFSISRSRYYTLFNTVELQETFYNPPDVDRLRRYRSEAPQHFIFTLKAWQAVTHPIDSPTWRRARFVPDKTLSDRYGFLRPSREVFEAWDVVVKGARALQARVIVVQTPSSFGYSEENRRNAIEFFSSVDTGEFAIGWEPRGTWLQNSDRVAEIVSKFRGVIHITDPFKALPAVDREVVYFRLHGIGKGEVNYRYRYSDDDLRKLSEIAARYHGWNRDVYIMFNNIYMVRDAQRFKSIHTQ